LSADVQREITKCSKCGKCRSVCPVFIEVKSEGMVARGRIALAEALLKGDVPDSKKLRQYLYGCLKCLRCADGCPSAVRFDLIISEARSKLADRASLPWLTRLSMRIVTPRRWLFDVSVKAVSLFQKILPRRAEGRIRHLPMMFFDGRGMPEVARKSVLNSFDGYYGAPDAERKVALFLGCLVNYAYPDVAMAMVKVFNHYGIGVHIPKGQACCGTPAMSLGDRELATKLAQANADAFRGLGVEAIICGCASGGATLKKEYPELLGGEMPLGAPVYDFSEFAAPLVSDVAVKLTEKVSWHDPCHLKFVQKIDREPREILAKAADFRDFEGADYCCGMGGVFSAFYPELSMKIAARKTAAVDGAGCETLATGCSGCMLQLGDRLSAKGSKVRVLHIAEVLAKALEGEVKA
jgi:glycolate oxidase iron-sulfur subunit